MTNLLVWPVLLPLAAAVLAFCWPTRGAWIGVVAASGTVFASALIVRQVLVHGPLLLALGGWTPGLGIALRADALAATLLVMSAVIVLGASLYATQYFNTRELQDRLWPLWMLAACALNALFLTADLFNMYVTLELLGLAAVALTVLTNDPNALRAGSRYLMAGLVGSLLFLAGVVLIYTRFGTLDLLGLAAQDVTGPAAWVAFGSMSAGLLVKCALFPLHFWLPNTHAHAPAPVSAVLSALVVKAGFYLLLRLWFELHDPVPGLATELVGLLGAAAVVWGSWQAFRAERLKLLAAYSTVAQMGYLFMFFPLLGGALSTGAAGSIFGAMVVLTVTHAFAKSALFLAAGCIQAELGHDRIDALSGIAKSRPVITIAIALACVGLIGLPPSGAFVAKWQLMSSALVVNGWIWVTVVIAGTLLAAGYSARLIGTALSSSESQAVAFDRRSTRGAAIAMGFALIATFVIGLWANAIWTFVAEVGIATGEVL